MAKSQAENKKVPKFQILRDKLFAAIKSGEIKAGERLPTERELAEEMGTARMTVREALLMLEGEGWISRRKKNNRGWFVDPKRIRSDPTNHLNITKLILRSGGEPGFISHGWRETKASFSMSKLMGCEQGTELLAYSAVVLWDDRKIVYDENYLLKSYFPDFSPTEFYDPITDFLKSRFGVVTTQVGFRSRSTLLYGEVAENLEVPSGAPGVYQIQIKAHEGKVVQVDREFWLSGALDIVIGNFPKELL